MIDPTPNNLLLSNLAKNAKTSVGSSDLSANSLSSTFSQMLSSSMLSGGGLLGGASSSDSSGGSGLSSMMMPIMMMLLEQMLAQQTTQQADSTTTQANTTANPLEARGLGTAGANLTATNSLFNTSINGGLPIGRPVSGVITQNYNNHHFGLDFGVPVGTNVKSTMTGKVVYAGWNNEGYGNLVIVENGSNQTYYGHLSSIPVKVGDSVNAGQVIGLSGNTGNSTGPHLHYEIRRDGTPIDPTARTLNSGITW